MTYIPIKGNGNSPKKQPKPLPDFGASVESVIKTVANLQATEKEIKAKTDAKMAEVDKTITLVEKRATEIINAVQDVKKQAIDHVKQLRPEKGETGTPGKDAPIVDEKSIIDRVLDQVPKPQEFDIKSLTRSVLKAIPESKASLKIIQEKIEFDPMSVIEKIMELPDDKFRVRSSQVTGLKQTLDAFKSQLSRGYLHGGGDTVVAGTGITIVSNANGTKTISSSAVGGVASVSNSDGSLTISPTTGVVIASLNVSHANNWTAPQNFHVTSNGITYVARFIVDNSDASAPAIWGSNSTSFAHGGNIALFQMLNGTDSGNVVQIDNHGTGASLKITADNSTSLFSVLANGNIIQNARYTKLGNASPNNTVLSAGSSPGVELWGTDNTVGGVTLGTGNTSAGTSAYTGFFLNNDLAVSNDFTHFGGLFLNSSGYNDTTFGTAIAVPNLLQLQNTDGPIAYAAVTNSGAHIFYVGNTMAGGFATVGTGNEIARINNVGIGVKTTTPLTGFEYAEQNTNTVRGILTGQYSTGTSSSRILLRKARGTLTSPTTVVTGDNLGALVFEGYDGTNYLQMGVIIFGTEGTIGTNRVPTNVRIQTATNASPSVLTTAVTIDSAQLVTFAAGYTGRKVPRVTTAADATSITPNTNTADWTYQANTQAAGTLTINADAGTGNNTQAWGLKIKSTNVQTFSWNAVYAGGANPLPAQTSGGGVIDYYTFIWDSVNSRWHFTGQALSLST